MLDVRNGVPPPKPRLFVTLRIPSTKRRREMSSSNESSDAESDVGAEEVIPEIQRPKSEDTDSRE